MMHTLRNLPLATAVVVFLYLCTVVQPPNGSWRAWVVALCWLVMLVLMLLHFFLR